MLGNLRALIGDLMNKGVVAALSAEQQRALAKRAGLIWDACDALKSLPLQVHHHARHELTRFFIYRIQFTTLLFSYQRIMSRAFSFYFGWCTFEFDSSLRIGTRSARA